MVKVVERKGGVYFFERLLLGVVGEKGERSMGMGGLKGFGVWRMRWGEGGWVGIGGWWGWCGGWEVGGKGGWCGDGEEVG